jgi:hypothetical protein
MSIALAKIGMDCIAAFRVAHGSWEPGQFTMSAVDVVTGQFNSNAPALTAGFV